MVNEHFPCTNLSCLREYVVAVTECEPVRCTGDVVALCLPLRRGITPELKPFIYLGPIIGLQSFGFVDPSSLFSYGDYENAMPVVITLIINFLFININQLDALNFIISLFQDSTCFEHMCSSAGGQKCIIQSLVSSHL